MSPSPSHSCGITTRESVKRKFLPFSKRDIQNLKNYREQMAGILSNLGLGFEQERKEFYKAVDYGFIDVAKELHHLFQNPNIRDEFLKKYPKSEAIDIVEVLNGMLKSTPIDDYEKIVGTEELSIVEAEYLRYNPELEVLKNLEKQERLEWVKGKYILFIKDEFPKSKEYHTHITGKSFIELAEDLQVYDSDNSGKHLTNSVLFTEYCEKAHRSKNLAGHHTHFATKIRRFLTNIKEEAHKK